MAVTSPILNVKNRLFLVSESAWGTFPGSPAYVYLPHRAGGYGVRYRGQRRRANPQTGLKQQKHGRTFRGNVSGPLNTGLYGWTPSGLGMSLAKYLLDWAIADPSGTIHEAVDLPSKSALYMEGPDVANKLHTGLRVNQATLVGNGDAGTIDLNLDLIGVGETNPGAGQAIPTDMNELVEFEFPDVVFRLDTGGGLTTYDIDSFQLQIGYGLQADYVGSRALTMLGSTTRDTMLQVQFPAQSDFWDAYRRTIVNASAETAFAAELVLKGLHMGTGGVGTNWAVCTLSLPLLKYVDHDDNRGRDEYKRLPLQFEVPKIDGASNDVNAAWSEAA